MEFTYFHDKYSIYGLKTPFIHWIGWHCASLLARLDRLRGNAAEQFRKFSSLFIVNCCLHSHWMPILPSSCREYQISSDTFHISSLLLTVHLLSTWPNKLWWYESERECKLYNFQVKKQRNCISSSDPFAVSNTTLTRESRKVSFYRIYYGICG